MKIVRMEETHIPALAVLERQCFHAPWSEQSLREELEMAGTVFLVAVEDGKVLGYVGCQTVLDEGYITNVAVSPDARRRGIARALLCRLTDAAHKRGLAFVTLEVRASNAAAVALYAGQGYEKVGVRKGYYRNPEEDAILMTRYLEAPDARSVR